MNSRMVLVMLGVVVLSVFPLWAHEPLFGLGPHTVGKYSWAVESELEKEGSEWANHLELLYGLGADVAITLAAPYLFAGEARSSGWGDVVVRGKYRFIRRDFRGGSRAFALHLGVKLASGSRVQGRGTGTVDVLAGLSFGLESRRHYSFAAFRYRFNGQTGRLNRGDAFHLEGAYGIRPWLLAYHQPDLVVLLEVLFQRNSPDQVQGVALNNSGGTVLSLAPGFLFSIRNVMIKGGWKFPVGSWLRGEQPAPDQTLVLGIDIHMPPLK